MGWSIGYDNNWDRFIGYGVPAFCDHPECNEKIDRGLAYVCCNQQPYGGDDGCGLYFCPKHHSFTGKCERCAAINPDNDIQPAPFEPKPEHPEWIAHILNDSSWARWRSENPRKVAEFRPSHRTPQGATENQE